MRLPFSSFEFSKTFTPYPTPLEIDIESQDGDHSLLNLLPENGFAIVGTRLPQRRSFELLERVFHSLQDSHLIIVSGLARGIDSRAHELAIEYGLKTVAVLGCGIDRQYPRENQALRKKIISSGGLVLSQFHRQAEPFKSNFLNRNQLIAGLSKAVWIVEAAAISGTLNTAVHAAKFNRELFATPCFPGDPFFQGNEKLLSEKDPFRYPKAYPLFSANCLTHVWPDRFHTQIQPLFDSFHEDRKMTPIQRWVLEITAQHGSCPVQTLMNHAYSCGFTLGHFYRQYENALSVGELRQDENGQVYLNQ